MEVKVMKNATNKILIAGFITLTLFLFSGCQNLFIPANVPVILHNNQVLSEPSPQQITIQSYTMITSGIVQDITNSGNNLIL